MKKFIAIIIILSLVLSLSSCKSGTNKETTKSETTTDVQDTSAIETSTIATTEEATTTGEQHTSVPVTGIGDKLVTSGQINQALIRSKDWKQIVKNSQFRLGEAKSTGKYYLEASYGTYPLIDGSTTCEPMAIEFGRQHLGLSDNDLISYDTLGFVYFNTTGTAYNYLIKKTVNENPGFIYSKQTGMKAKIVDILIATEPSDQELAMAKANNVTLIVKPVCYDSFVFITHKNNPVSSLTVEQVQKIYTGEITNWKEVGGKDEKIFPFQREENSGSQTTMEKQVMKGKKMIAPTKVNVITEMGELVKTVSEYKNSTASIGYTFKYYIDKLYKNENIKVIKINGIAPTNETMQNSTYPFTTNYFGVIRAEDKNKTGGKFLDWMLSSEGQACIVQAGYCPLK